MPEIAYLDPLWEPGPSGSFINPGEETSNEEAPIPGVLSIHQISVLLLYDRPYLAERELRRLEHYHPHLHTLPAFIDLKMRIRAALDQEQTIWNQYLEENPDALKHEQEMET